jgi:hypothetical protein
MLGDYKEALNTRAGGVSLPAVAVQDIPEQGGG